MKSKRLAEDFWDSKLPFPSETVKSQYFQINLLYMIYISLTELPIWVFVIIITCISVLCFSNSYYGAFVFDDSEAIVNNHDINLKTPVIKIFSHDFWGTRLTNNASHKSYRPLTILSFRYIRIS